MVSKQFPIQFYNMSVLYCLLHENEIVLKVWLQQIKLLDVTIRSAKCCMI